MLRFEQFTAGSQDSAARAFEILQRYRHNQVDTEHILLALLEQPEGLIPPILEKLSVDQEAIKKHLTDLLSATPPAETPVRGPEGQVYITPRVKQCLDLANEGASLKDELISTEHIFLAILSERDTAVARILAAAGITKERVQERTN